MDLILILPCLIKNEEFALNSIRLGRRGELALFIFLKRAPFQKRIIEPNPIGFGQCQIGVLTAYISANPSGNSLSKKALPTL